MSENYFIGGEDGIRTHETSCPAYTLSKRAPSTTRTPLQTVIILAELTELLLILLCSTVTLIDSFYSLMLVKLVVTDVK